MNFDGPQIGGNDNNFGPPPMLNMGAPQQFVNDGGIQFFGNGPQNQMNFD